MVGSNDHPAGQIEELLALVGNGPLDLSNVVTATVPLAAEAINDAMAGLERFDGGVRTVVTPTAH